MTSISALLAKRQVRFDPYSSNSLESAIDNHAITQVLWSRFDDLAGIRQPLFADGIALSRCTPTQRELLRQLGVERLVTLENGYARAASDRARQYLAGHWLEDLVAALASHAGAEEVRVSQRVLWHSRFGGSEHANEIDVIIRQGERMAFISCKAMRPETIETSAGPERLFDAILEAKYWAAHFGDVATQAALVTTADLYDEGSGQFRDPALAERARVLDVRVLSSDVGNVDALRSSIAHLVRGLMA